MDQAGRFQRKQELRRDGGVVTSLGVDVVTGLAVLIYDFEGAPLLKQGFNDVDGVPAVLAAWTDGGNGTLVAAHPSDAIMLAPGESVIDDQFVLQALTVLRDAARRGLVHGDLNAGRFLWAGRRLYIEGYGVPWRKGTPAPPPGGAAAANPALEAGLRADLARAAAALIELGVKGISGEVVSALKGALSAKSPPDAAGLQAIVRRLAGGPVKVPSAGFVDIVLPTSAGSTAPRGRDLDLDSLEFTPRPASPAASLEPDSDVGGGFAAPGSAPARAPQSTPVARPEPPRVEESRPPAPPAATPPRPKAPPAAPAKQEPDPITLLSDPGLRTPPTGQAPAQPKTAGFVKDLPPGATYRAGNLDEALRPAPIRLDDDHTSKQRRKAWRGPLLLLLLLLVVALGSFMALRAQRNSGLAQVTASAVRHLVDVRVSPGNLPPVSLVVDRSPDGSSYQPGTIIGSVPRRVSFDANGTWIVHAQFQGRASASVTLRVPEDTGITLLFPEPDPQTP